MKALVYEGPSKMILKEIDEPVVNKDDVKIRVRATGICGSDTHGYLGLSGRRTPPMIMGHEFAGEVAGVGTDVTGFQVGDRVTADPKLFCGECEMCRSGYNNLCTSCEFLGVFSKAGSMAEYISVPAKYVIKMPDSLSYEYGALIEPFAVGYHSVILAGDIENKTALIIGAGTIGLMVLINLIKKNPRAIIVSDINESRLKLAKSFGAFTVNPEKEALSDKIKELTGDAKADVTFEAVGSSAAISAALVNLKDNGVNIQIGNTTPTVSIPLQQITVRQLTIKGTNIYTFKELKQIVQLLAEGDWRLDRLISKKIPMEDAPAMMDILAHDPGDLVKVLIVSGGSLS